MGYDKSYRSELWALVITIIGLGVIASQCLERKIEEEAEKAGITIPLGEKRKLGNSDVRYCGRAIPQQENFYLSIDGDRVDYPANSKRIKAGGIEYDVVLNPDSVYLKPVVRAEKP